MSGTGSPSDLSMGFAVTGADDVARSLQSVAGQLERLTQRQQANTSSTRAMAQASTQTTQSFAQMVQQGQQVTQRIQGVAGAVQALVGQMGGHDRTSGMIASVAGATAQFASMGAMLGPTGAVVGGIVGLGSSIVQLVQSERAAAQASTELANQVHSVETRARTATERIAEMNEALERTVTLSNINLGVASDRSYAEEIQRVTAELEPLEQRIRALREGGVSAANASAMEGAGVLYNETNDQIQALRDRLAELSALRSSANAEAADIMAEDLRAAANPTPTRRGGGGRRPAPPADEALSRMNAETEGDLFSLSGFNMESFLREDAAATLAENTRAAEETARTIAMIREAESDAMDRSAQKARDMRDAQRELVDAARETEAAFSGGYVTSIDAVVEAYHEANTAAKDAGRSIISSGRLMERSMIAVGNNISETIGGTMVGAFEKALGAWMDGSKSFVEAAEEMVKGVLKALVIESIVQAVTETARGIADLASYRYDSGAMHLAAAAAWGAVGVAAGAVGAGIGAFGGGGGGGSKGSGAGGGSSAPSSRELAGSRRDDGAVSNTYNIEIYPGGYVTRDQVARGMIDGLNHAVRNGASADSRLIRR